MVCFGYVIVYTLYKGENKDDDDDDNNNRVEFTFLLQGLPTDQHRT